MMKRVLKPRKKLTLAHIKKIATAYNEIYSEGELSEESFIAGFLAAKKKLPNYKFQICTKCHKLLPSANFGIGRPDCRSCRYY